jgi:cell division protein FtsL
MFGEFFNGADSELFESLKSLRIGASSAAELLEGKFLDGLENGILDFEASITEVAKELEEYGKKNESTRKAYLQAAKQLFQWINQTFSKDNLSVALKELEKEVKSLTTSFEKTNEMVDLYRKLQENGTAKQLGLGLGVSESDAAAPDSVRQRKQVLDLIAAYNKSLPYSAQKYDIGDLSTLNDVYLALDKIIKTTELNSKNFSANELPNNAKDIENMLKQLIKTLIQEYSSISGKAYTGDASKDVLSNAVIRFESGMAELRKSISNASDKGTFDYSAIEKMATATQEDAKKIFDQFMSDNRLDVIAREGNGKISDKMLDDLEAKLKDISKDFPALLREELLSKLKDLRNKVGEYNASIGAWGSFGGAIRGYRNANENAKREYDLEVVNNDQIKARIEAAKLLGLPVDELNVELALSNERLKSMGENGEKLAEDLRKLSLANMQKSIQQCQEQFSSMVNSVNAVVDAAKAFANTINKVYDVMNDGENPAWMQDMESFLGDFGDAFGAMIAPMMSIISLVATLTVAFVACEAAMTPLLIVMGVLIAVAAVVAGVIAAFQQHDRSLQRSIEDLEEQIEDTQTAMKNLDAAAERMVGIDKFKKQLESLSLNMKIYHDALEQARLEEEKKNTDEDKVEEYMQNAQEALDAFKNGLKGMFEEITGSVDELADAISSAMRSAFQSGENAARNMAAVVKENIGNIVEEIMKMNYLKPAIETAMNALRGGSEDWFKEQFTDKEGNFDYESALDYFLGRLQNDENVENFEDMMNSISTGYIDLYNSLSDTMKEYFSFSSDNSALSGGISGITEDTARTLEGLANSMLMQMILTNRELSTISQSGFAQVQVSWFNDMLQQARATRTASEQIKQILDETRSGIRPLKVEVM